MEFSIYGELVTGDYYVDDALVELRVDGTTIIAGFSGETIYFQGYELKK